MMDETCLAHLEALARQATNPQEFSLFRQSAAWQLRLAVDAETVAELIARIRELESSQSYGDGLHWAEGHGEPTICGMEPQPVHVAIGHHPWDIRCRNCHTAFIERAVASVTGETQ